MPKLFDRIVVGDGSARIADCALPDLQARIEAAGSRPLDPLDPLDIVAVIAATALGIGDEAEGPPLVSENPPFPRLADAVSEPSLERLFPNASRASRLALRAGLCQILDLWEASHEAAQLADDLGERTVSAYWHGVAHRREPDPGNASYWFRRVGRHPLFPELARSATPLLRGPIGASIADRVLKSGSWDPFAFIEVCTRARPGTPEATLARRLQRLEMATLLDCTLDGLN